MSLNLDWNESTTLLLIAWGARESEDAVNSGREGDAVRILGGIGAVLMLSKMAASEHQWKAEQWLKLKLYNISEFLSAPVQGQESFDDQRKSVVEDLGLVAEFVKINGFDDVVRMGMVMGLDEPEWLLPEPYIPWSC